MDPNDDLDLTPNGEDLPFEMQDLRLWHPGANGFHRQRHVSLTERDYHDSDRAVRALEDALLD